ncbi:MAG: adenylate/guanylate cyclase domain-containing protein, partial [Planctomicrobium sp.]|nr:adenylate/guanylate cyclase domain-containing protein [Planctomicrobium sp.]
ILDHGGVTGDFLGDAVLGFWGWPFNSDDAPLKACRAALAIREEFARIQREDGHPLQDFHVGIGVAHGRAVAGQIGTSGRMAVTVFGPVVNLASRLEGMTKKLRVPIVMDETTSQLARDGFAHEEARIRTLGKVLPYGMEKSLIVSELIPPMGDNSELTDEQLDIYEKGVAEFREGRWEEAYNYLHSMPSSDQAQDFLLAIITQNNRRAPPNWRGVIELPSK